MMASSTGTSFSQASSGMVLSCSERERGGAESVSDAVFLVGQHEYLSISDSTSAAAFERQF